MIDLRLFAHLMEGLVDKEFLVNNIKDNKELARVVEKATKEVFLCYVFASTLSPVKRGVGRASATAIVYNYATMLREGWLYQIG